MALGEFAQVQQHVEAALHKPTTFPSEHDLYAMRVEVAVQQRAEAEIRHYAALLETLATTHTHQLYLAIAHRAWGVAHRLAGEYPASELRLQQARTIFEMLDTRWQLGRTWAELGELATAQNNLLQARVAYQHALQLFEALGAKPDADRTHTALQLI